MILIDDLKGAVSRYLRVMCPQGHHVFKIRSSIFFVVVVVFLRVMCPQGHDVFKIRSGIFFVVVVVVVFLFFIVVTNGNR